jgi:hypothetical protein
MASRTRSTFEKRQKEMKRMEKQRMKAARRAERSLAKRTENTGENPASMETENVLAEPEPQS